MSKETITSVRKSNHITVEGFLSEDSEVFDHIRTPLFSFIKKNNPSLSFEDTEDVLQITLKKAWENLDSFNQEKGAFASWIFRIAHNTPVDEIKRKKMFIYSIDEFEEGGELPEIIISTNHSEPLPEETVISHERQSIVKDAIEQLPLDQKTAITLGYFGGLSSNEISEMKSIPVGTVKGRIRLGKEKMKDMLDS